MSRRSVLDPAKPSFRSRRLAMIQRLATKRRRADQIADAQVGVAGRMDDVMDDLLSDN